MLTFLEETLHKLKEKHSDLSELTIILPSNRAGGFLKNILRRTATNTGFAPQIISIEHFIERLSDLKIIDSTELLFKSYEAYKSVGKASDKEDFDTFAQWATSLLNDFNEVDRYLVDPKRFFTYLGSIKTLERWNIQGRQTELVKKYLGFWEALYPFYETLKTQLLKQEIAYQGLVYRRAAEEIEHYVQHHGHNKHVFIGFNALNTAEQHIVQELLETGNTEVYWDVDQYLYEDTKHSASLFVNAYFKQWKYYQSNTPNFIASNFNQAKRFHFVEAQKNIVQVKYIGTLLKDFSEEQLNKTAIVLADEALLLPLLHSLPSNVNKVNITMGVPLKTLPSAVFFELLLAQHLQERETLYFGDVVGILNHPIGIQLVENAKSIIDNLTVENRTHFDLKTLMNFVEDTDTSMIRLLFGPWNQNSATALKACLQIVDHLHLKITNQPIGRISLYHLHGVFSQIKSLNQSFAHLKSLKSVQRIFSELVSTTTLDYGGDAYEGLQIMGVLETRVLDFENIIMSSVNEGILPTGKSNASFITYDLKKEFSLPLFAEKDAIYTYHFYRLLHRAQNITLLYNSHSEGINSGEKSRFLLQLETEKCEKHQIIKTVLNPEINLNTNQLQSVQKTPVLLEKLKAIAASGFSPSALTSYIRNPIEFYHQKVLDIKEHDEIEETVAANTLGTIVHDTLEVFYKPLEGQLLSIEVLKKFKAQAASEVEKQFRKTFKAGTYSKGKNLIIFEVAKRYISNFIDCELSMLKAGNSIKILQIETKLSVPVDIPSLDFPVKIGGKVDRVDLFNDELRIIDYKTGLVKDADLSLIEWDVLSEDYKYSKAFQVLAYATMINNDTTLEKVEAGIISFKNLQSGFLKFGTKTSSNSQKTTAITKGTLAKFHTELAKLITEICNPGIPFTEKET